MRPGGGGDEQHEREQFEEEEQGQLETVDFCAAGFGLDMKAPQQKARHLAATEAVPQNINRRERRQGGEREHGERICQERNHRGGLMRGDWMRALLLDALFPLTLTLSLGEREQPLNVF